MSIKVRLIKKSTIDEFIEANAQSRMPFYNWLKIIKDVDWGNINDLLQTLPSADLLGKNSDRIIFDIGGNNYRMICGYLFGEKYVHLFIKWIGTHAEYDKLCKKGLQYTINMH